MSDFIFLQNSMIKLEEKSVGFIPSENFYIISIEINNHNKNIDIYDIGRNVLIDSVKPLVSYVWDKTIILIFSSVPKNKSHYLNGNKQLLISHFTSQFASLSGSKNVITRIIECEDKEELLTYMSWKIQSNYKKYILSISSLEPDDIKKCTIKMLINKLKEGGINWDDDKNKDKKFGCFYKLVLNDSEYFYCTKCGQLNALNMNEYKKYIFGSEC